MSKPLKRADVDVWMPLFIGDYLRDTTRLTTEQHGAYLLLIMDYWTNGAPPDDDAVLAQITRSNSDTWPKLRAALAGFFSIENGKWIHSRIEEELAAAKNRADKAHTRAKTAAEKRWGTDAQAMSKPCLDDATSNATSIHQASDKQCLSNARGDAKAMLEECPSPSPSPLLSTKVNKNILSGKPDAENILAYLNEKAGRQYRAVGGTLKPILARLADGYTVDMCKAVIDAKVTQWRNDPQMEQYLRPDTLFRASKFPQYAGQITPAKPASAANDDPESWRSLPQFRGAK